jgi:hypothetical protein
VVPFEFQSGEPEMRIIIQAQEDIYPEGIAITRTSLNRAGRLLEACPVVFAFTERKG